ncbi:TniQ family protein [Roseovarius sp. A-2]|uniref:TniQ family protein n=1 Tax=Roseovarius sp. A-2 TaxID=1570360 RepID=UPI0020CB00B4|nr:TniQ family protein [Roseovarius sp. A-2]
MGRVSARYGLETPAMTAWLVGQGRGMRSHNLVDDIAPEPELLRLWARACRVDPARLMRLSLTSRFSDRPPTWFLERPRVPVCLACFDADCSSGRDSYLRWDWKLADHVACPTHGEMLCDRCPACSSQLQVSFRFRGDLLRSFCRKCDTLLTGRGGERLRPADAGFVEGVLDLQRKAQGIVRGESDRRARLEQTIRALWAPLDRMDAARPVLALWFDQPGWNCPFEARGAVSTDAPLQHLPVRWRALTLVILGDLFGAELVFDAEMPETARSLFSRAAPLLPRRQRGPSAIGKGKPPIDGVLVRVQSLSKSPVHRLSGNFLDERADFSRIHP